MRKKNNLYASSLCSANEKVACEDTSNGEENFFEKCMALLRKGMRKNNRQKEIRDSFDLYLSKDWDYMGTQMFFESNITVGRTAINNYAQVLSQEFFYLKKKILAYQADLYLAHKKMPSSFIKPISE